MKNKNSMEQNNTNEVAEEQSVADRKLGDVMPPEETSDDEIQKPSDPFHTEEDMKIQLEKYKDYKDISKQAEGVKVISLAKQAYPGGLKSGQAADVKYNGYEYKVVIFKVSAFVDRAYDLREEPFAFKGDKIEGESEEVIAEPQTDEAKAKEEANAYLAEGFTLSTLKEAKQAVIDAKQYLSGDFPQTGYVDNVNGYRYVVYKLDENTEIVYKGKAKGGN